MTNPLLFLVFFTFSAAISGQPPPQPPSSACKSTLYPKLCLSVLSAFLKSPSSPDSYSKFSVEQSLEHALNLSDSISHFLANTTKQKSPMIFAGINALNDCRQLQELNVGYLEFVSGVLESAGNMSQAMVGSVHSLLSAVVTNQQTCYDGLAEAGSGTADALASPVGKASEMYSVSLGLVTQVIGRGRGRRRRNGVEVAGRRAAELDWARCPTSELIEVLRESKACHNQRAERALGELWDHGKSIQVNDTVTVSPYGGGNFSSINDAVASAPNNSAVEDGYFVIHAKQGYYQEYVVVPRNKKNVMLIGDGINKTVVAGNRSVVDGWTTFNSATFVVYGERFVAINVTFKNTAGPEKHQAVAVRNSADLSTFYRCSFEGYQDTLYVHSLRQFYRECTIYGTVDFIFGNAAAIFQNCNLFARRPMPNQKVALTAQGRTDPNQNTGISIQNCTIDAAPDLKSNLSFSSTNTYLGRPWKEYSRTVYMQSYIGGFVNPVGWLEWNGPMGLDTLYYGEYENYGPGANTSLRVKWPGYTLMNASQALNFTVYNFTMGDTWLPYTSIPFSAGLLL